ncbi:MAG TPA: anthrone oxygenase family protein, partial [Micromonosporaceae bacterium]|nr:anthrone oxygenase family protein [Micromonosporaceae bacterium]
MGLMAGLFCTFSYAVMTGLGRTDDRTFVGSMQSINVAIVNGWFLISFLGALGFTALAALFHLPSGARAALPWILVGLVLYVIVLGITGGISIPLNNQLVDAGPVDKIADLAAVREKFEGVWIRWNIVRAVLCTSAFGSLAWALVQHGRAGR